MASQYELIEQNGCRIWVEAFKESVGASSATTKKPKQAHKRKKQERIYEPLRIGKKYLERTRWY